MTQAITEIKKSFAILSTFFPIDVRTDERIKHIEETLRIIPEECRGAISDISVSFLSLQNNKIESNVFKAAQKVLSRSQIDSCLKDRNKLLKQLLNAGSVFTSILIDEVKTKNNLANILQEIHKNQSPPSKMIGLCMGWADSLLELEGYLHIIEELCQISLFQSIDGKQLLDFSTLAELGSLSAIAPFISKFSFSEEQQVILLKNSVRSYRFDVFAYCHYFSFDFSLHRILLLELAVTEVVWEVWTKFDENK